MDNKLPVPGSAARAAEQEPRTPSAKIEPGSAARMAEQSAQESTAIPREAFRGSMTIRTRVATGAKFQFAAGHSGAGEALPEGYKASASAGAANQSVNPETAHRDSVSTKPSESEADPGEKTPSEPWTGRLRKLFGR